MTFKVLARTWLLVLPLAAHPLFADVMYTYTGNPFTDVVNSPIVTTSNYISVTITMALPLKANISHTTLEQYGTGWPITSPGGNKLLGFTITDGVHTITGPANALVEIDATSATGQILEWHILAQASGGAGGVYPFLETAFYNGFGTDFVAYTFADNISDHQLGEAFINFGGNRLGRVGSWQLPQSDNTPPITTATPWPSPNINGWNNTNVTVNLSGTDNPGGSGVKQIEFALGGAQNTGWDAVTGNTASITISAEGSTILSYFATDNAGNQETAKTLTARIDKSPPVISGLPAPGCTIWPPNHKLVHVATVTAMDALSGLAPGSFKVTGSSTDPVNGQIVISGGPNQFSVQLGADKDQVYTLTAAASDRAGNTTTKQATCIVPHDQQR